MPISSKKKGSLVVVGSGIKDHGQVTPESVHAIRNSEVIFYCVSSSAAENFIQFLRPDAFNLNRFYIEGISREKTYEQMTKCVVDSVLGGASVCLVFFGHPGFIVRSSHDAMRILKAKKYPAKMLPGISSLDCMIADLGINTAESGMQVYTASKMLVYDQKPSIYSHTFIFELISIGNPPHASVLQPDPQKSKLLRDYLVAIFGRNQHCYLYRAALSDRVKPIVKKTKLWDLDKKLLPHLSTLYIPPKSVKPKPNKAMMKKLGIIDPHDSF